MAGLWSCCPVCRGCCLPCLCPWKESKPSGACCCCLTLLWSACLKPLACCAVIGILRVSTTISMNLVPITFLVIEPSMTTEGFSAFVPQSCTVNEANLFCTLLPSSSAVLDVKVKLCYQRTDFSWAYREDILIIWLRIFLHISPHKHTLIKYSLEYKKCLH